MTFLLFCFWILSIGDLVLTYFAISPTYELNPLVATIWHQYGYGPIVAYKFVVCLVITHIAFFLARRGKHCYATSILSFACGLLTVVCVQFLSLLFTGI